MKVVYVLIVSLFIEIMNVITVNHVGQKIGKNVAIVMIKKRKKYVKRLLLLLAFMPCMAKQDVLMIEDFSCWDDQIEELNGTYYVVFTHYHFVVFSDNSYGYLGE